jgi:hypothetical protein
MAKICYTKGSARRISALKGSKTSLQQDLGLSAGKIVVNGAINERQSLSVHNGTINGTINLRPSLSVQNPTITERPSISQISQIQVSKTGTVQLLSMMDNTGRDLNYGSDSFRFPNNTSIVDFHSL